MTSSVCHTSGVRRSTSVTALLLTSALVIFTVGTSVAPSAAAAGAIAAVGSLPVAGHHHRVLLTRPLRSAAAMEALVLKSAGRLPVNEEAVVDGGGDEAVFDAAETLDADDVIDGESLFPAAVRRGFRFGGKDRFSHGFGRKRSDGGWLAPRPATAERYASEISLDSDLSPYRLKRPARSTFGRSIAVRGGK